MLMEEPTPTGKTPHCLQPKMPKREISTEPVDSTIQDSHMTISAGISPIAKVSHGRPTLEFGKALISIKDDAKSHTQSVVETKNSSIIKEADAVVENESILKTQGDKNESKNKVRLVESYLLSEEINDELLRNETIRKF